MKKISLVPMILILIMAFLFTACASPPAEESPAVVDEAPAVVEEAEETKEEEATVEMAEPVKLTFWNNWDNVNMEVMNELVAKFNAEHPGIEVENVFQPYGEMMTLLQTNIASQSPPDMAAADLIFLPQLVAT
ncbi:MAG: extracellular solute-binding protein, partial [Anaerolineales bacterium]